MNCPQLLNWLQPYDNTETPSLVRACPLFHIPSGLMPLNALYGYYVFDHIDEALIHGHGVVMSLGAPLTCDKDMQKYGGGMLQ